MDEVSMGKIFFAPKTSLSYEDEIKKAGNFAVTRSLKYYLLLY